MTAKVYDFVAERVKRRKNPPQTVGELKDRLREAVTATGKKPTIRELLRIVKGEDRGE